MGNMEDVRIDTGLKKIRVNDYGDYIAVNLEDSTIINRYAKMIEKIEQLAADSDAENAVLDKKYDGKPMSSNEYEIDTAQIIERSELRLKYINLMMDEIDSVFGKNSVKKAYRECYEEDENFIPSEAAIIEFIDKLTPVMGKLYKVRFEFNKKKFNSGRRGKHTRTKQELLDELKEKSVASE